MVRVTASSAGCERSPRPRRRAEAQAEPGTGYGESEWSPSRRVEFEPLPRPFAQYFLKYTWRDTLCLQGVIDCDGGRRPPRNRFWKEDDDDDYAPPPPRYDRGEEWRSSVPAGPVPSPPATGAFFVGGLNVVAGWRHLKTSVR